MSLWKFSIDELFDMMFIFLLALLIHDNYLRTNLKFFLIVCRCIYTNVTIVNFVQKNQKFHMNEKTAMRYSVFRKGHENQVGNDVP